MSALEGIQVLDLTRTVAGPFCTQLLGDMGATVIKIERPVVGDETRSWPPFWESESVQFLSFNRNKQSVVVDLKSPSGIQIIKDLAKKSDVFVESFKAGSLDKLGLGYSAIKELNPSIVYCSISGFGRTGPLAAKPAYDVIIQAYSGLMSLTGDPEGPPQRAGFSIVDLFTGTMSYGSIVTALYHRAQSGYGQWIDSSLLDGQIAALGSHATGYFATGIEPHRLGSAHPALVPYQIFQGSDDHFILGCANDGLWFNLCNAIGIPELINDSRFKTNALRVENRVVCVQLLSDLFQHNSAAYWVKIISDANVPCGPINTVSQVVSDPQVNARGMIASLPHPKIPDLQVPGSPLKFGSTPASLRHPPPLLGQHTEEVLGGLGYSESRISELANKKVISVSQDTTLQSGNPRLGQS